MIKKMKLKGFSLAEVMVALLIVSLVLAAAVPTITKKSSSNSSPAFSKGNNTVIGLEDANNNMFIGQQPPSVQSNITFPNSNLNVDSGDGGSLTLPSTKNITSKLVITNEFDHAPTTTASHLTKADIAFYTKNGTTTNYVGRLALDRENIALGQGALNSIKIDDTDTTTDADHNRGGNTAIGHLSQIYNESALGTTSLGKRTLANLRKGDFNTALGYDAAYYAGYTTSAQKVDYNTMVGARAGHRLQTGNNNTMLGYKAGFGLRGTTVSSNDTMIGYNACGSLSSGSNNICIGSNVQSTASSSGSGINITQTDSYGLYIGTGSKPLISGNTDTATQANTFLQLNFKDTNLKFYEDGTTTTHVRVAPVTNTHTLVLGNSSPVKVNGNLEVTGILTTDVTIGTSSAKKSLTVTKDLSATGGIVSLPAGTSVKIANQTLYDYIATPAAAAGKSAAENVLTNYAPKNNPTFTGSVYLPAAGNVYLNNTAINKVLAPLSGATFTGAVTIGTSSANKNLNVYGQIQHKGTEISYSDIRLKDIIGDNNVGLKEISQLKIKNYTFKDDKNKEPRVGVIAQELQKVMPDAIVKNEQGYLMVKEENLFFAVINSIKELYAKFQDLVAKVTGLDKRIEALEAQNQKLIEQNAAFEKRFEALEKNQKK